MNPRILFDVSHTCHTRARTGIQRVVRGVLSAAGPQAIAVTYDPYAKTWRELRGWERANLGASSPGAKRGAHWPASARFFGRVRRLLPTPAATEFPIDTAGTVLPEIFNAEIAIQLACLPRPRVAVFHDAIALKLPEYTPQKTVARFPAYLRELLEFDGVAAVSDDSRDALVDYWRWLGVSDVPPVRTISLGIDGVVGESTDSAGRAKAAAPTVLSVGSIEGRKNHLALVDACEQLWANGAHFELRLIGMARPETAAPALARIRELQAKGRALRHDGAVDDATLEHAYASCAFTVYPSLMEGFGLPVLESLARGKPCLCSRQGALGEAAREGGCVTLPQVDAASLAPAIERLLIDREELARLSAAARRRKFRSWREYADELTGWLAELRAARREERGAHS